MKEMDCLSQILDVRDPWKVVDISVDTRNTQLDIYLGFDDEVKKNLFGAAAKKFFFGRAPSLVCPECNAALPVRTDYAPVRFQHLPIAGLRTYLHVPPPDVVQSEKSDCVCQRSWAAPGLHCTPAMRNHALAVLQVVAATGIASQLVGLPESELKEIVKSLQVVGEGVPATVEKIGVDASGIPHVDHPVWQLLIKGEVLLETNSVPLRMLLQRIRRNYAVSPGPASAGEGAEALRQFFLRNKKILHRELQQLGTPHLAAVQQSGVVGAKEEDDEGIPAADDQVWKALIYGDLRLQTTMVGLQMLIEKARTSIGQDPSDQNFKELTASLRKFVLKHRRRLSSEIGMLQGNLAAGHAAPAGDVAEDDQYPQADHPVWLELIRGEKKLSHDILSFNLLLQTSRRLLGQEPTETRILEEADKVRNFIMKYKKITAHEIQQLT